MRSKKFKSANPLGKRILDYVKEKGITLTEMSLGAGLSAGTLRQLVIAPDRRPSLETCMRLSSVTGWPIEEILELAQIDPGQADLSVSPDVRELQEILARLPHRLIVSLVSLARELRNFVETEGGAG